MDTADSLRAARDALIKAKTYEYESPMAWLGIAVGYILNHLEAQQAPAETDPTLTHATASAMAEIVFPPESTPEPAPCSHVWGYLPVYPPGSELPRAVQMGCTLEGCTVRLWLYPQTATTRQEG
jgi:hypothetical protein